MPQVPLLQEAASILQFEIMNCTDKVLSHTCSLMKGFQSQCHTHTDNMRSIQSAFTNIYERIRTELELLLQRARL